MALNLFSQQRRTISGLPNIPFHDTIHILGKKEKNMSQEEIGPLHLQSFIHPTNLGGIENRVGSNVRAKK